MKRKILNSLMYWKENRQKTPLMLIGARQTGKTYILKYFCETYFADCIYMNFDEKKDFSSFFEDSLDPESIIRKIEIYFGKKINIEKTIIFFDEIQVCERGITSLKYFCESEKPYAIVCAGSLLGVAINRTKSSFPVGKVHFEYLFPLDFEEFLWGAGEEMLADEIRDCFAKNRSMNEALHNKALGLYKDYLYIGGMPQSVLDYIIKKKNIAEYDTAILSNIINAYIADMSKYATGTETVKINAVFLSMPGQLARENRKFTYKLIHDHANKKGFETSLEWLMQSKLVYKSAKISLPLSPLKAYQESNYFKLYLSDVGILVNLSKLSKNEVLLNKDMPFRGALTENYVAEMLTIRGHDLYYWQSGATAEIDFILNIEGNIIPVEVKSSDNTKSKSLKVYIDKYNPAYSIRISSKNFGYVNKVKSIPLYAVHLL